MTRRLAQHEKHLIERGFVPASTCSIEGWGAVIGLGIAAAGTIAGAEISGNASKNAAQIQANAAGTASGVELSMFDQTQANLAPYMKSGTNALSALNYGLGVGPKTGATPASGIGYGSLTAPFTAADYQASPGYAWQMSQGIDAVQNSASAAGGIGGGNTLKALTTYGQGLANTDYQQAYQNYVNRQQQQYGMLSGQAGAGQNAAANLGGFAANVGGQVGSNTIGAGNALAAGTIGSANAVTGGVNSLAQLAALYGNASYGGGIPGAGGVVGSGNPSAPNTYGGINMGGNTGYYCDYVLKDNIERVHFDHIAGLWVYSFRYKSEEGFWHGYIAQEVREKYPQAVSTGPRGFLIVDYAKIPKATLREPTPADWDDLKALCNG